VNGWDMWDLGGEMEWENGEGPDMGRHQEAGRVLGKEGRKAVVGREDERREDGKKKEDGRSEVRRLRLGR